MKAGWEVKALGEITSKIGSGATPRGGQAAYKTEGISLIRSLNVHDLWFKEKDLAYIDNIQADALSNVVVQSGDVLLNITGASIARCCTVPDDKLPARVNQHVSILRPDPKAVISSYLSYLLTSKEQKDKLLGIGDDAGATRQALTKSQLQTFKIPLPPLDEQKRIVAVLDAAFEGLTRARTHVETNLQNARELIGSFVANIVYEASTIYASQSLSAVSTNLDRLRVPITKSQRVAGDVPYYGASGVVDHVAEHLFDEDLLLISEDGANLLARTYPIAFSVSGKSWVNNHAHVLRFDEPAQQAFAELYLNSISIEPYVSGMAQPKLNQQSLNKISVPMPPPEKCEEIEKKSAELRSRVEESEAHYRAKLQDLDDLRQSLLQKAFAGELT